MTGRRYSDKSRAGRHDFGWCLKKNGWIFPVGLAAFLLLIPFSTAGLPGDSIFNIEVTHDQMKFRLFHEDVTPVIIAAALLLGMVSGIALFRFVHDKKETTIFFSLGITRTRLFINRALAGLLMIAFSIIIPMGLSLFLNYRALGMYEGLVRSCIYLTAGITVMSLTAFFITAAMSSAAGTTAEALVYSTGLLAAPTILFYGAGLLMDKLYWGNAWGAVTYSGSEEIKQSVLERLSFLNPILFFEEDLEIHGQFVRPLESAEPEEISGGVLLLWVAICAGTAAFAWQMLKRRKAEMAGITGSDKIFSEVIILITGFSVFSAVFSFLYEYGVLLAAGLGVLAFAAVHLFWRKTLFSYNLRRRRGIISAAGQAVVIACLCLVFSGGFFGYAEKFLENGSIAEASVTYVGAPALLYETASGSSTGNGYYLMSEVTVSGEASIEKIKELQKLFIDSGRQEMAAGSSTSDTVIPYDICFSYLDENGKEHIWYYDRASYAQLEQMLSLEECSEVKQAQVSMIRGETGSEDTVYAERAYASADIYLTNAYLTDTFYLSMTDEDRDGLLEAIAADIENMTVEDLYFPEVQARAVLMFTTSGENDCKYYTYHLDNCFLYLTPAYENTLDWLEKNDLLSLVGDTPEIEYIYLQKFDPYIGINGISYPMGMYFMAYCADSDDEFLIQKDFGNKYTVTDETRITELSSLLQDGCYMSRGGYLACVKIAGEDRYRYMFLPEESVPDFIRG